MSEHYAQQPKTQKLKPTLHFSHFTKAVSNIVLMMFVSFEMGEEPCEQQRGNEIHLIMMDGEPLQVKTLDLDQSLPQSAHCTEEEDTNVLFCQQPLTD